MRKVLPWCVAGLALLPQTVLADGPADPTGSFGLSWFLGSHHAQEQAAEVELTLVHTDNGFLYVADLYGDGLVRFKISEQIAATLLDGTASAKVRMDVNAISNAIGAAALGSLSAAATFRQEQDSLVLESSPSQPATEQNLIALETQELHYFKHEWNQPGHIATRRSRSKSMQAVLSLTVHPAQLPNIQ